MNDAAAENIKITSLEWSFRALNVLSIVHTYNEGECSRLETLGDIAKLSEPEILRVPGCGRGTLKEIEAVLQSHGLSLENNRYVQFKKDPVQWTVKIKELEENNDRLLMELGYLQSKIVKIDQYERQIEELEQRNERLERSLERAWNVADVAKQERDTTRDAAMEAIRQLQVEMERLKHIA